MEDELTLLILKGEVLYYIGQAEKLSKLTERIEEESKKVEDIRIQINALIASSHSLFFKADFKDSQSGMWAFKKHLLDHINLTSNGMPFSQEIKIEAYNHGKFKCMEVPIEYRKRMGKVKLNTLKDGYHNFKFLFSKKFKKNKWQDQNKRNRWVNEC